MRCQIGLNYYLTCSKIFREWRPCRVRGRRSSIGTKDSIAERLAVRTKNFIWVLASSQQLMQTVGLLFEIKYFRPLLRQELPYFLQSFVQSFEIQEKPLLFTVCANTVEENYRFEAPDNDL
jgi:hypothetical protein